MNFPRLQGELETLSQIGRREGDHGLYRRAFSDAQLEACRWFEGLIREAGLDYFVDGATNVHARLGWDGQTPSVMTGSHLDTVPGAGHLDGALGVIAGFECVRRLKELGVELARPIEAVAFADEEGRFGGMMGSQAMAGKLTPETILSAQDLDGVKLADAMQAQGFEPMHALRAQRRPESLHAFVELHIEQGPVLDRQNITIGAVEGIVGLFRWNVRLMGTPNHAGTTPMDMRNDALQGLAEVARAIPRILEENGGPKSVATIGRVELTPGAANVVPGRVDFSLDVRDLDQGALDDLAMAFRKAIAAIARRHGLMFEFDVMSELPPVRCDPGIIEIVEQSAEAIDQKPMRLPSGAAHDTQTMAHITRVGMVFVPSVGGRSHSAAEWTPWEAIERGANVLLRTLYQLASS